LPLPFSFSCEDATPHDPDFSSTDRSRVIQISLFDATLGCRNIAILHHSAQFVATDLHEEKAHANAHSPGQLFDAGQPLGGSDIS
jgi:hypothetical protein